MIIQPLALRSVGMYACAVALVLACTLHQAQAQQSLWDLNSQFDRGIDILVARQQGLLALQQQQIRAVQMQAFGPQLIQAWHQSGLDQVMSFEQFRYQMLISANGTNPAFALDALRRQHLGNRIASDTLREAGDIRLNEMREGSARRSAAVGNWSEQAMRGQGVFVDAYGNAVRLPNYARGQRYQAPNGAIYWQGTDGYWRDQNGYYLNSR